MKKDNFIKTVTSHITDKTRKAEVFAELGDHFESRKAYFKDIGYEEEPAAEKAEQAFGDLEDAELVGEQLSFFAKEKSTVQIIISAIALLIALAYYFAYKSTALDSAFFHFLISLLALFSEILIEYFSLKKKLIISSLIACIGIAMIISNCEIQMIIMCFINKNSLEGALIRNSGLAQSLQIKSPLYLEFITVFLHFLNISVFGFNAMITIRNKRLKTTKKELKITKNISRAVLVSAAVCGLFAAVICANTLMNIDYYHKVTYDTLCKADNLIIKNIDVFMGDDVDKAAELIEKAFGEKRKFDGSYFYKDNYFIVDEDSVNFKKNGVTIFFNPSKKEGYGFSGKFTVSAQYYDLTGKNKPLLKDFEQKKQAFIAGGANFDKVPLPCVIHEFKGGIVMNYLTNTQYTSMNDVTGEICFDYSEGDLTLKKVGFFSVPDEDIIFN